MEQTVISGMVNGVDVDRMGDTIKAINGNPGLAKFQFRLENRWINGSRNQSTIKGFSGAGLEALRQEPFALQADEPMVLLGQDTAPNPAEYVLQALASCLTTSLVPRGGARHQNRRSGIQARRRFGPARVFGLVRRDSAGLSERPCQLYR